MTRGGGVGSQPIPERGAACHVLVVTATPLVGAGVRALLEQHPGVPRMRVDVAPVAQGPPATTVSARVDVVVHDAATPGRIDLNAIARWVSAGITGPVLSGREHQVLCLVGSGRSSQEIATELHLSLDAVKTHIRTAYRALGFTRRAHAVLRAIDNGVVPAPPAADA